MPSGSGTSIAGEQLLFSGVTTDTKLLVRFTSAITRDDRLGIILILLGSAGNNYVWQAATLYRQNRIIVGIPPSPSTSYRYVIRWNVAGLNYAWNTLA